MSHSFWKTCYKESLALTTITCGRLVTAKVDFNTITVFGSITSADVLSAFTFHLNFEEKTLGNLVGKRRQA